MKQAMLGLVLVLAFGRTTAAAMITFETQGNVAQVFFTHADPPLLIDVATFTGGQVLNRSIDGLTFVYGTADFCDSCTNPLNISFASPVTNLSVLVINHQTNSIGAVAVSYTLADNSSHTATFNIPGSGSTTLLLPFAGITSATITGAIVNNGWNFFIDNVSYNAPTTVPEPASIVLFASGLLGVRWMRRRRTIGKR